MGGTLPRAEQHPLEGAGNSHPNQIVREDCLPGQIVLDDSHPDQVPLGDSLPGQIVLDDSHPNQIVSEDCHPGQIVLDDCHPDQVLLGDNLQLLPTFADGCFQMVYIDPPFNRGGVRRRGTLRTVRDPAGDRVGFGGRRYRTSVVGERSYEDSHEDYLGFLAPRLEHARRLLGVEGTLYFHIDFREAHRCKLLLDEIFGEECFINEIIWAYDYGGRSKRRWPAKHDTILVYVRDPERYHFDSEQVDREPYMAPGLVTPEKAAKGKLPTDVWWHTIVATNGKEKTGYPTQKPVGVLRRMVQASTRPGEWCLDFFAGSGTLGAAAAELGRRYVLIDSNPDAVEVMRARLG